MRKKWTITSQQRGRLFRVMLKLCMCFWLCATLPIPGQASAQNEKLDLEMRNVSLKNVLWALEKKTEMVFFYSVKDIAGINGINVLLKDKTLDEVLDEVLKNTSLCYEITHNTVVLRQKSHKPILQAEQKEVLVKGQVYDKSGSSLPGVTVMVKGTKLGVTTDMDGFFQIRLPKLEKIVLTFSFVGMEPQEVTLKDDKPLKIIMKESSTEIDEVVITGIYSRKKESFTGSSKTFTTSDLKSVGNQNLLQSLKTLDPSFAILENNQFGSDPNRLPDVEIRGKSSIVGLKEQFGEDPNQPLFILDGFETTLQVIMDLSMDRIASVTILKDAASTAIYGAKAANGVMVVETKSPTQGRVRVSYNGNFEVSFADLTDYNLMNAKEKLEFELKSGNFKSTIPAIQEHNMLRYNTLLADVERGVDTYWMSEPLRLGLNQRHNLYVEGGDKQMRYGLGINYNRINGVMEGSSRQVMSGNLDLLYRKEKLSFSNKLTVDFTQQEDPVVPFSKYSRANPYYRKQNEFGGIDKWLELKTFENAGNIVYPSIQAENPLYNASLNSYDRGNTFGIQENLNIEYRPLDVLYIRARAGLTKSTSDSEEFTSPEATEFEDTELLKKGSYSDSRQENLTYEGDLTVTYGQLLGDRHQVNAVFGSSLKESSYTTKSFSGEGFPEGGFDTPGFVNGFPEGSKPGYVDYKKRYATFYFNGGYSYDNRYLLDVNFRADGSSVFGVNRQFTTTWAVGLAWNLHNEKFIKEHTDIFTMLKLRASVGNPGNQNFGSFNAKTTYKFNNWMINNFGSGFLVDVFGDPDLEWQKTLDKNIGFDLSVYDNRLHINFDYYHKSTDPLLASVGIPLSIGVSNRLMNIGRQIEQGITGTIKYAILYRPSERINYTTSLTFRHNKGEYNKIGNKLSAYNRQNTSKTLSRYYDGGSPTALWAMRSEGIDPATGREIFLTTRGERKFNYSYDDEVVVGDTRPTLEGVWGNSLYWKGFSCSIYIRYSFGAEAFNQTLYQKVENISVDALKENQDRRALYDRWQKPGDHAKFKRISLTDYTPISSRFVQKNNYLVLESIRLGYEFKQEWMDKIHFSGMTVSAYMNDIARFSTIKTERGIEYPFARSISFALSLNF